MAEHQIGMPEPEYFAQFGEDRLLWQLFGGKRDGFFIEVGANHPTLGSQTCFLERQGWRGILVEPLPQNCRLLREQRPGSRVFQLALAAPEQRGQATFYVATEMDTLSGLRPDDERSYTKLEVEVRTLDDVLAECDPPRIDLLSIDVEGTELEVLRGFSLERYQPAVLLLEDHLQSLKLHRHVCSRGYRPVKRTDCNTWYVPRGAEFPLNTFWERLALRKEFHLDTPVRILRFALKRWRRRRAQSAI